MNEQILLAAVIGLSLLFTYTNGFQDGSSVTATAIACRALTPMQTVILVACVEFLGAIFGGSAVAAAIGSITSWPAQVNFLPVLACALAAAIAWNFLTRKFGLPSSSTHALVGGIVGAVVIEDRGWQHIVFGRPDNIIHSTGLWKVILSLFVSPLVGFSAGLLLLLLSYLILSRCSTRINKPIKSLQWIMVGALAFGHGANDTQKAMGVIVLALHAAGVAGGDQIPLWVRICSGTAMALGVASLAQGIVKRVGSGIFKLQPLHALVSQISSAAIILVGSLTGGPVAASQVIASTVIGVGTAQRRKGVHWIVARDMIVAWFLTIPGAALLAGVLQQAIFHWLM